jgi:hypothetical protein
VPISLVNKVLRTIVVMVGGQLGRHKFVALSSMRDKNVGCPLLARVEANAEKSLVLNRLHDHNGCGTTPLAQHVVVGVQHEDSRALCPA